MLKSQEPKSLQIISFPYNKDTSSPTIIPFPAYNMWQQST